MREAPQTEVMDGYPDIYDQLVETDTLRLRDRCRRAEKALVVLAKFHMTLNQPYDRFPGWVMLALKDALDAHPEESPSVGPNDGSRS